ncbi:DUF3087 family protein [Thiosulfativibrio zosterae]|uniref:DUF3087 domain-containing protein n=1 Tax=Thiosulfativibrio zosterae TaxID=2675053 RepID=A0A6F8PN35_9GAMM|nr:DUF3087 family protein [Thiosulfativibrio zosterae]BBP43519.1 hypothetical protein THMIRHAT_12650 [Thiosulfativibrio zosterae]
MSSENFKIQDISPEQYRKKSRNATLIIMGIFLVIGFAMAVSFVNWWGEYTHNQLVLNFMGALVGLAITAIIVKTFFIKQPWMAEAMYGVRLKRHLMMVTNKLRPVQEAAESGDENAMKIMRFYHLGLTQMHKFENNHTALLDMAAEKQTLENRLIEHQIDLNQIELNPEILEPYQYSDKQSDSD